MGNCTAKPQVSGDDDTNQLVGSGGEAAANPGTNGGTASHPNTKAPPKAAPTANLPTIVHSPTPAAHSKSAPTASLPAIAHISIPAACSDPDASTAAPRRAPGAPSAHAPAGAPPLVGRRPRRMSGITNGPVLPVTPRFGTKRDSGARSGMFHQARSILVAAIVATCVMAPAATAEVLHQALAKAAPGLLGCLTLLTMLRPNLVLRHAHVALLGVMTWTVIGWGVDAEALKRLGLDVGAVQDGSYFAAIVPGFVRQSRAMAFAEIVLFGV
uniref:Uncharacterized protein n=1 Tax=Mantoniella antarctica TaxID=81844 RepID=A0A7S0SJ21_9CHLO|mmetsp:Transcript_24914/g.62128  ORF Transcript_24914/g.62128 Transcript_24914/m.62128 type:complete len:270 (+) Transcript_24914:131-940(+)